VQYPRTLGLFLMLAALPLAAQSIDNARSCDIAVTPAATLLLPYFEVDTSAAVGTGSRTLFTVTNTSRYPQIARVTLWTDWGYAVLSFHLFLTGYDVQGIDLYDVLVRGIVAPLAGVRGGTDLDTPPGTAIDATGSIPFENTSNPNFLTDGRGPFVTCRLLPGVLPDDVLVAARNALRSGFGFGFTCGTRQVGSNQNPLAHGYVTIDVVSYCAPLFPDGPRGDYFVGDYAPLLFDNVLLGDYQQVGATPISSYVPSPVDAQGSPMVHIRAIPEGGLSGASGGAAVPTNLPYTFYDRYTPAGARTADRRQPLPSMWVARYIQGGSGEFVTELKIWREGVTGSPLVCSSLQLNSKIHITTMVRFDEHENSSGLKVDQVCDVCIPTPYATTSALRMPTTTSILAPLFGNDLGGWMFLNLSSGSAHINFGDPMCNPALSAQRHGFGYCSATPTLGASGSRTTTQSWVVGSMFGTPGGNRLKLDFDAAWLGNGCTPAAQWGGTIAPSNHDAGALVCPGGMAKCGAGTKPRRETP